MASLHRQKPRPNRDSFSSEVELKPSDQFNGGDDGDDSDDGGTPTSPFSDGSGASSFGRDDWQLLGSQKKAEHPLAGLSHEALADMGREYAENQLALRDEDEIRHFTLGAIAAGMMDQGQSAPELRAMYDAIEGLTEEEKQALVQETSRRWKQRWNLYFVVAICSLCAAVQGMDETVVNGAQSIYKNQFGIGSDSLRDTWLLGLTNSAPYLCCAVLGCWLTAPMNKMFGRRGTIFISCAISAVACIWQAFTGSWWSMFISRFVLGLGIGPKSATAPIFAAECSPKQIRGALTMQWQVWTAFGIMLGYAADLAFLDIPDGGIEGLSWRLMMGSAAVPAIAACGFVYMCPESPRWFITKNKHSEAFAAMSTLRRTKVQAARDLFYAHTLIRAESEVTSGKRRSSLRELFTIRRNRNALIASEITMFMQQFCGVNIIAYYSSDIFLSANFTERHAYLASLGFGIVNFIFALPAFYTIDTFGRRNLLLATFPLMAVFLLFTGFSFWIPPGSGARIVCIALGIYLFGVVYSPGAGPVPFTYSAEAYPLRVRTLGMSLATATTWFFNFVLAVTWPSLEAAFTNQGAFSWYAGWNVIGFFLVLLFLPETKGKTLEELNAVFDVSSSQLIAYGWAELAYFWNKYVRREAAIRPEVPRLEKSNQTGTAA